MIKKNKIVVEIARQVRAWRDEQCFTQTAFAKKAGLKQTVISRVESGKRTPSVTTLLRIAKGFGAELSIRFLSREMAPTSADLVEKLAATIYDAHPRCSVHARWADLEKWVKQKPNKKHTAYQIELHQEVMEARREEARAVLHELGLL